MSSDVSQLVHTLNRSRTFDDAAAAVLDPLLQAVRHRLSGAYPESEARILRGMVYLRSQGGYRGLTVLEDPAGPAGEPPLKATYVPSGSAWRWLQHFESAVAIDVTLAMVQPLAETAVEPIEDDFLHASAFGTPESQRHLLNRHATHVCLFPVRLPGGRIDGAVSLEAWCPAAVGLPFIWSGCASRLQLLVDIAAPHLLTLPLRPGPLELTDEWLPVVGESMRPIIRTLRIFAQQDDTILLSGPTGTGKSRLARWCHAQSSRRSGRFEVVDLQSVPEEVQLGELFGWKRGAFTGATADNPGHIALAEGGTLFIDEIDKLSLRAQAGFLQLLEERTYRALGDTSGRRRANVRFIVGTNVDLLDAVRQGRFREDLFYRIQVLPVRVPAMAERLDELPLWAQYMLERRNREHGGTGTPRIAAEVRVRLLTLPWPGNLRQLDNIIRRAYSMALLEYGGPQEDLVLRARHIDQALACEDRAADSTLLASLRITATAILDEIDRHQARGQALPIDPAEALQGAILLTAIARYGSREEAFRRLGKEGLVRHRNHHKVLKRELLKVLELSRALGREPDEDLTRELEADPGAEDR